MNWKTKMVTLAMATAMTVSATAGTAFAASAQPTTSTPAANLRVTLDRLFGEHSNLAILAMEKGYSGAADFSAVANALGQNTADLTAAITSVYGAAAGQQFNKMWTDHIGFFVEYVQATAKNDAAGKQDALNKLAQYKTQFSNFLASANPNLNATDLANNLQMHIDELLAAFNAYVNKDYTTSWKDYVEAYNHMFATGDALAGAIAWQFPAKFGNTSTSSPAIDLRVTLDRLLGEHADLAMIAMQKGIDGAPDFQAAAGELNQNTNDLSAAIASVYGAAAGSAFQKMWADHIGDFVNYVVATSKNDAAGKQSALDALSTYKNQFANFLATANPNLNATDLENNLQMHVDELLGAFNSYVAKDYTSAYSSFREGYSHMFGTGDALSAAIVQQFPSKFASAQPTGMPVTGLGGATQSSNNYEAEMIATIAGMVIIAAAAGMILRKRSAQ